MSSITYVVSILKDAGFKSSQLKPATPTHINKVFSDYLNSCEWSEEWFFAIDPSQLDGEQLKLYDSAKELYDTPDGEVLSPVEDMMITLSLQLAGAEMDAELDEPVRDDVKLLPPVEVEPLPVEVIIIPQEVVSEPQEDCLSTTTLNEDTVMNTSTFIPSWEVSGYVSILNLDFGTYVPVVESEPTVELTGQYSEFACHISDGWTGQSSDVLEGWTGQCSELTCDVLNGQFTELAYPLMSPLTCDVMNGQCSDVLNGWFGQCCDLVDAPKPVQLEPEQLSDAQYRVQQACAKMARRSAYASPVRCGSPVVNTPTITTKSGDIVKVSDEEFAELSTMFDKAMAKPKFPFTVVNRKSFQGNQINPDCSRTKASIGHIDPVTEFKSTLFNVDEYDITRNVVVDVATTTPKSTPATPKAPKPSTATFAPNFNSLVMAKYRELNGGVIRDSLILNKLTSALRANNSDAYANLVTTFNNPTAVALHRQAYDAVVSAS